MSRLDAFGDMGHDLRQSWIPLFDVGIAWDLFIMASPSEYQLQLNRTTHNSRTTGRAETVRRKRKSVPDLLLRLSVAELDAKAQLSHGIQRSPYRQPFPLRLYWDIVIKPESPKNVLNNTQRSRQWSLQARISKVSAKPPLNYGQTPPKSMPHDYHFGRIPLQKPLPPISTWATFHARATANDV